MAEYFGIEWRDHRNRQFDRDQEFSTALIYLKCNKIKEGKEMKKAFFMMILAAGIVFITSAVSFADCPDSTISCAKIESNGKVHLPFTVGEFQTGNCWSLWPLGCYPCKSKAELAQQCVSSHSDVCSNDRCAACEIGTAGDM